MSAYEFVQRGKVLIVKKQYQDAVKVCRLGLLAHPTLVEGRLVLGMALMALGRYDEVLAEMRVALQQDQSSPLGHLLKGEALLRKGDVKQAADVLGRARDLDPGNDKVTSLLDELQGTSEEQSQPDSGATTFGDITNTRQYPATRSHDGSEFVEGPPSSTLTAPRFGIVSQEITNPIVPDLPPPSRVGKGSGVEFFRDEEEYSDPLADLPEEDTDFERSEQALRLGAAPQPYVFDESDVINHDAQDGEPDEVFDPDALETVAYDGGSEAPTRDLEKPEPPRAKVGPIIDDEDATGEDDEPEPTREGPRHPHRPVREESVSAIVLDSDDMIASAEAQHAQAAHGVPDNMFEHEEPTTPESPGAARRASEAQVAAPAKLPLLDDDYDGQAEYHLESESEGESESEVPTAPAEVREYQPPPDEGLFRERLDAPERLDDSEAGPPKRYPPLPKAREVPYPPPMVMPISGAAALPLAATMAVSQASGPWASSPPPREPPPPPRPPPRAPGGPQMAAGPQPSPLAALNQPKPAYGAAVPGMAPMPSMPMGRPGAGMQPMPASPPMGDLPPNPTGMPQVSPMGQMGGPMGQMGGPMGQMGGPMGQMGGPMAQGYPPGPPPPAPPPPAAGPAVEPPRPRAKGEPTGRTGRKRRRQFTAVQPPRRGLGPVFLIVLAVVVVGVAVGAGLLVRSARLKQRLRRLADGAEQKAAAQTYRGYATGVAHYQAIYDETGAPAAKAAGARLSAALVYEFGDLDGEARREVQALGSEDKSREALCARVYLALADGEVDKSLGIAAELVARYPQDPEALYLHGRALEAKDDPKGAADRIRESINLRPTPLAMTTLGVLEAQLGNPDEGLQWLEEALKSEPGHPTATIEKYRLLAATGNLDKDRQPDATFRTELAAWTEVTQADETPLISRAQTGWANLSLAEILLSVGKDAEAKEALRAATEQRPLRDARFSAGLIDALLRVGASTQAREEAERALQISPQAKTPHVWMAKIALVEGRPDLATAELDKAGIAASGPEALAVRGRARLALGDLDGATKNLDEALSKLPDDVSLIVARALVEREKGDNEQVVRRLEVVYQKKPDPELGVVFGAALATSNRERARQILDLAARSPRGASAHLELARLNRLEGRWEDARKEYELIMQRPGPLNVRGRLEVALLKYDLGDAIGARESLDVLARENPGEWDVQLAAAMLHAVTGSDTLAQKRVDDAARLTATPPWRLAKERGRLAFLRGSYPEAVKQLNEAARLKPDDIESRLLLMDAYYMSNDTDGMKKVEVDVIRRFEDRPEARLAEGRFDLALGRTSSAITQLEDALTKLSARAAPPRFLAEIYTILGHAYLDNYKRIKARAFLERAVKLDPSSADAHYWLGMVSVDARKTQEAREEFEEALTRRPNFAQAWYDLGEVARKLKDKKGAERAFRKYLELAPDGTFASDVREYLR